jgi:predicted nucleotidyltransferase
MDRIVTLAERKAAEAQRRRQAVAGLRVVLTAYARAHGGGFLLYGSAARGDMRAGSDVDILADFPRDATDDAWVFAEDACRTLGLTPDIRPVSWCGRSFLDHILPELEVLR